MIVREKKINPRNREVQLLFSLAEADQKHYLRLAMASYSHAGATRKMVSAAAFTESGIRQWAESDPKVFGNFKIQHARSMSAWLWYWSVQDGYFVESATAPGEFFPTDKLLDLAKWQLADDYYD